MTSIRGRALHYVFKIGDRQETAKFYRNVLGMKVLRHEEFSDGCEATCNGPYANRWSKTMIGYGSENTHFVVELTYNYPIKSYELGNDFIGITICSQDVLKRARNADWPILPGNILEAPGGYKFYIIDEPEPKNSDPIQKVTLACSNLTRSISYWNGILGLQIFNSSSKTVLLGFENNQAKLELQEIGTAIDRAEAYGRIAFSCPFNEQPIIEDKIQMANEKIVTPLISLDTPGKATVRVIILADPDGHEICFVDDESYRELSEFQPDGDKLLDSHIAKEK